MRLFSSPQRHPCDCVNHLLFHSATLLNSHFKRRSELNSEIFPHWGCFLSNRLYGVAHSSLKLRVIWMFSVGQIRCNILVQSRVDDIRHLRRAVNGCDALQALVTAHRRELSFAFRVRDFSMSIEFLHLDFTEDFFGWDRLIFNRWDFGSSSLGSLLLRWLPYDICNFWLCELALSRSGALHLGVESLGAVLLFRIHLEIRFKHARALASTGRALFVWRHTLAHHVSTCNNVSLVLEWGEIFRVLRLSVWLVSRDRFWLIVTDNIVGGAVSHLCDVLVITVDLFVETGVRLSELGHASCRPLVAGLTHIFDGCYVGHTILVVGHLWLDLYERVLVR